MKNIVIAFAFLSCLTTYSQALYRSFPSDVLGEERNVKILKPRNYNSNQEKTYPLILVLDGDYLFEPVSGVVDYLSYWDQMPESFVVGINQRKSRYDDTAINVESGFPEEQAQRYMDFIMELVTTMQKEYRVAPFTVLVAKDINANLASFFLMRKKVAIDAFLQIEPDYTTIIQENLVNKISSLDEYNYFYVATSAQKNVASELFSEQTDSLFSTKENVKLKHESIEETNFYNVAAQAIPRGLDFIFNEYQLVEGEQLLNSNLAQDTSKESANRTADMKTAVQTLLDKYEYVKKVYGIDMKLRLKDLVTMSEYIIREKDWEQLLDMATIVDKEYPDIMYGKFIEGMGYEGIGRYGRAIKSFEQAYILEEAVGLTKDDCLDKVEALQAKE